MISFNSRNLPLLLCLFLPFTYIVGILITEIFVLFLTLYFLFFNKDFKYFKYKQIIALLIFSFYIASIAVIKIDDLNANLYDLLKVFAINLQTYTLLL